MADFTDIVQKATELESVVDSAVVVIDGIAKMVADAVAANDAGDNSQLATLSSRIEAKKTALAEAIARNTPGEPPEA